MKDLIIGCSDGYKWDQIKYWINSINKTGFDGEKVLLVLNGDSDTIKKVIESGFKIISPGQVNDAGDLVYKHVTVPHVERFFHIQDYLKKNLDIGRVVTTDVRDVVFQSNPFHFMDKLIDEKPYNMIFAAEGIRYKDEPWGDQNLMETYGGYVHNEFKHNEVYNVGILAGYRLDIQDLLFNIFMNAINRPIRICDQAVFNFMIMQTPYVYDNLYLTEEDEWCTMLAVTGDPTKVDGFKPHLLCGLPSMENGIVYNSLGKEFVIVHQYDRVPDWRSAIEEKYS